jgi:hypothetical protein
MEPMLFYAPVIAILSSENVIRVAGALELQLLKEAISYRQHLVDCQPSSTSRMQVVLIIQPIAVLFVVCDVDIVAGECSPAVEDSECVFASKEAKHAW